MRQVRSTVLFLCAFIFAAYAPATIAQGQSALSVLDLHFQIGTPPMVAAHRAGPAKNIPENSLAAIKRSLNNGYHMIEIDVNITRDGEMVLFHDKSLNRTMGISGRFNSYTYDQLKNIPLLDYQKNTTDSYIPTLDQAFSLLQGKNIIVEIDLKDNSLFPRILDKVKRYGLEKNVLFIAYTMETALAWQKAAPWVYVSFAFEDIDALKQAKVQGLDLKRVIAWMGLDTLNAPLVQAVHAMGIKTVFGTIGASQTSWDRKIGRTYPICHYKTFTDQGADIIVTAKPSSVLSVISGRANCS